MKINNSKVFSALPHGVLLDTDNTLYDYGPCHTAAQSAVRNKVVRTLAISDADFDRAFVLSRDEVKKRLGQTASSHSRLLYMQRVLETVGVGSQVLLALDFEQTYWRTFLATARLFPGVTELLDDLRILGIPTAIVTDLTAQIQFRKVVYFGLDNFIDFIVTSEEAGADKPHPDPFKLALSKLRPSGPIVWMIGDEADTDIRGAREAIGAVTLQKIHKGVHVGVGDALPDATFTDYSEIRGLLRRLSRQK